MICKICGCEMKNNGDWFACPTCGSVHFGPDPDEKKSAEKPPVKEEKPTPAIQERSIKKDPLLLEIEKDLIKKEVLPLKTEKKPPVKAKPPAKAEDKPGKKAEPPVKAEDKPEKKAEPPVKAEDKPIKKAAPPVKIEEKPVEKHEPIVEIKEIAAESVPEPSEKQEIFDDKPVESGKEPEDSSVKPTAFTPNKTNYDEHFATFLDRLEDIPEEIPPKQEKAVVEAETEAEAEEEEPEETGKKKKKLTLKDVVDFMLPIVAAVVIAFVLKTFIIANAKVPTGSMIATINIDDRIIASRLAYRTDDPQRYDIVLFYYPDDESDIFVKRVLGLPGETIEVIGGIAYVTTKDGKMIQTDQSFVNPAEAPRGDSGPYYIPEKGEIITVDGSYCFAENGMILGSSKYIDKYCVKDEKGNYVIAENLYFMMGDNRNYSSDSREWNFSFVAEDKIIGKVLFKYYPSFEKIK